MALSNNTQAILLLTARFSKGRNETVKPLTTTEWGRFTAWLKQQQLKPGDLNTEHLDELLEGWVDKSITSDRLGALMRRGNALALAVEKWQRAGLWVMTRSDSDYPERLKQHLKSASPPVLFGCGKRDSLNKGGLAVVGSRKANQKDLAYSRAIGAIAASTGVQVISGGARGVDEAAMLEALQYGGAVIGVVADSLMKASHSLKYRRFLSDGELVLVSPFYPESGFSVGQAMHRNKFIYCLSNAGFVIRSDTKGGTWSGAMENINKNWVPLWVRRTAEKGSGNEKIFQAGARWAPENVEEIDINELIETKVEIESSEKGLFSEAVSIVKEGGGKYKATRPRVNTGIPKQALTTTKSEQKKQEFVQDTETANPPKDTDEFYELFLSKVQVLCKDNPKSTEELASVFSLQSTQLKMWLKKATDEGKLKKRIRPVSYQWIDQGELPL